MALTNKQRLEIYDRLRQLHQETHKIDCSTMDAWEESAIDAVQAVLYLAEGVFAKQK